MAPWGDTKLFFCLLFITCCCTVSLAQIAVDCCLTVNNKEIQKAAVANYRQQVKGHGCSLDAVIFLTRHGKKLCASPDQPWINGLMRHVDHVRKLCKKSNYTLKRCFGIKPE